MSEKPQSSTILGAGAWGTALALLLAKNQQITYLWGHDPKALGQLEAQNFSTIDLPLTEIPKDLHFEPDLKTAINASRDILIAVPSHAFANIIQQIAPLLTQQHRLSWATKGLDASGCLLHEIVEKHIKFKIPQAVISGPSFAREVAAGLPTAVLIAASSQDYAKALATRFQCKTFRVYISEDIVGAELAGAIKNVLAIAVGCCDGLQLGANARSALMTRGLAEMMRLGLAMHANTDTFTGLAGIGDLILTASDDQSRNRRFGLALAQKNNVEDAKNHIHRLVEGISNAKHVFHLAKRYHVEMPICEQVYKMVYEKVSPKDAVSALLTRHLNYYSSL